MPNRKTIRSTASRPRLLITGALVVAFLGLGARVTTSPDDPSLSVTSSSEDHRQDGADTPPTSITSDGAPIYRAPAGMVSVLDTDGNVVGYVREDGVPHSEAVVQVGARELRGQTVVDDEGRPTGYLLGEIGFVSIDQARSPDVVDQLLHEAAERRDRFIAEQGTGPARPSD